MHALDTMRALASKGELITLQSGDVLFKAGETGSTMFGIFERSVRLAWTDSSHQHHHKDIQVGHNFGSGLLVVEDHRRLSTATARCVCRLVVMNREKFLFAVQEAPMFAIGLLASIDARLRGISVDVMASAHD